MTARLQRLQASGGIPLEVLVSRLAANGELLAQIGDRKSIGLRQRNKTNDLFHRGYSLPRHRGDMCNPSLRIKCYLSLPDRPYALSLPRLIA